MTYQMEMFMDYPRFPLPVGHTYGPGVHPSRHRGDINEEGMMLAHVQRHLQQTWKQNHVNITGRFDGPTQGALQNVQVQLGLHPTGILDEELWDKIFTKKPG